MAYDSNAYKEELAVIQKINEIFLGTKDFRELASRSVTAMFEALKHHGVLSVAVFRTHETENLLYAYAYASKAFETVEKLFPKKFSELSVSLDDKHNLLVRSIKTGESQVSQKLVDFTRPTLPDLASRGIQKVLGFGSAIAFPLRLKQGKIGGTLYFNLRDKVVREEQRILLEAFRRQFELAFDNVVEFEQVLERYKRNVAKVFSKSHEEDMATIKFTLRITPKQEQFLSKLAEKQGTDKATLIRELVREKMDQEHLA